MRRSRSGFEAYGAVDLLGVKADENLVVDDQGRRRAALQFHQFTYVRGVPLHIAFFEDGASLREVCLDPGAGRSSRLRVQNDLLVGGHSY